MIDTSLNRLSAIVTILCSVSTIYGYFLTIPIAWIVVLIVLAITSAVSWYYWHNKIAARKSIEEPYRHDYELMYHKTTIDIRKLDGTDSTCHQINKLKCLKDGANNYYFRYWPSNCFTDFDFFPGTIQSKDTRSNGTDIIVKFEQPCKVNEIRSITITSKLVGLLTDPSEYWSVQKYYNCTKAHILEVIFPPNVSPSSYYSSIAKNDIIPTSQPTKAHVVKTMNGNRVVLTIESNELKLGQKLRLNWDW